MGTISCIKIKFVQLLVRISEKIKENQKQDANDSVSDSSGMFHSALDDQIHNIIEINQPLLNKLFKCEDHNLQSSELLKISNLKIKVTNDQVSVKLQEEVKVTVSLELIAYLMTLASIC